MDSASHDTAASLIDAHRHTIDDLHRSLAALPGAAKEPLQAAVDAYKEAHKTFRHAALECIK